MNKILRAGFIIAVIAGFWILMQPGISNAETYEVLKELSLSNGTYKGTITPQISPSGEQLSGFKGLEISVKNGEVDSKYRVACAEVSLDNKEIFSENDFNSSYVSLSEFVEYDEDTSAVALEVRASGTWKSTLTVKVTGVYEEDVVPQFITYYMDMDGDGVGGDLSITSAEPLFPPWVTITGDINDMDPYVQ